MKPEIMIATKNLVAALQQTWLSACPMDIPTQFPGTTLDVAGTGCWCEFWVTQAAEAAPQRSGQQTMLLFLDVHCFSRTPETFSILDLADRVRQAFSQQILAISSAEGSVSGHLRLYEAVLRDLTRESTAIPRLPLQHVVVSLNGRWEIMPAG
jgi:hypothetical protein